MMTSDDSDVCPCEGPTDTASLCETCGRRPWIYRCPGCHRKSCSLPCVKQHKVDHSCDGKRCKSAYIPLSQFNDQHLFNDYYFLEDVGRFIDSAHRDRVHGARELGDSRDRYHSLQRLRGLAERRGTNLVLQPPGMSLHSANTSRSVRGKRRSPCEILWRIHIHFPHCGVEYQEEGVSERTLLSSLLKRYIHPTESDPIARHRLQRYVRGGGVDGVEVFMRAERVPGKPTRFYHLDKSQSLCDNLRHKTVVEFPTFLVVLAGEAGEYKAEQETVERDGITGRGDGDGALNSLQMIAQVYSDDDDEQ